MSETIENKETELEKKIAELETRNSQLNANISALSTLNPALYAGVSDSSDEIDLRELWNAIWSGKWLIIAITSVFALASVIYALSLPNEYKSTVLLAPASSSSSSSLSKLAGQFGGLASLAGINLGGGGADDKSTVALEIIKTWGFLEKFIEENKLQVALFAAKGWNRSTNELIIDPDLYDVSNETWVREFDANKGQRAEPSSWELFEELKDRISISQDKASGLISLTVEYYSPIVAKEWTDKLVMAINIHIQEQDRTDALKSIGYLKEQINKTNVTDMQSVFYQLVEEQTKTLMLAEVSDEYVLKTLSPAKAAELKSKPKRALICILGIILGGLLAVAIVLIKHFRKTHSIG